MLVHTKINCAVLEVTNSLFQVTYPSLTTLLRAEDGVDLGIGDGERFVEGVLGAISVLHLDFSIGSGLKLRARNLISAELS